MSTPCTMCTPSLFLYMYMQYCRFSTNDQGFPHCAEVGPKECTHSDVREIVIFPMMPMAIELHCSGKLAIVHMCVSVCPSVCSFVYMSVCPSVHLSLCLSVSLSVFLSAVCLSVLAHLSLRHLFAHLSISLTSALQLHQSVCLCLIPNISLRLSSGVRGESRSNSMRPAMAILWRELNEGSYTSCLEYLA